MAKWLEFSLQMYLTPKAIRETFLRNHQCWIVLVSMWNIHCKMINFFAVFFSVDDCDRCDIRAICVKGKCQCRVGYTGDGYQCTKSKFIIFKLIGSSCCNADENRNTMFCCQHFLVLVANWSTSHVIILLSCTVSKC